MFLTALLMLLGVVLACSPLNILVVGIPLGISPRKRVVWIKAADDKLLVMESACSEGYLLDASSSNILVVGIPLEISPRKRVVWIKAADDKLLAMESAWWDCPLLCFSATPVKAVWRDICWMPPAQGFLKFNTDGAARGKPGIGDCDLCGNVLDLLIVCMKN
ncbi:hypothetical protein GOBAR_DD06532 [Gossypium barbadense]|nr:hypothetical protein GOBAR_DD06532 [Gossypium barbadense]